MKIFKDNGTKEKLFEMMQKVNNQNIGKKKNVKKSLNENQYDQWGRLIKKPRLSEALYDSTNDENDVDVINVDNNDDDENNPIQATPEIDVQSQQDNMEKEPEPETNDSDIDKIDITGQGDEIEGGLADNASPDEFDPNQILKGMEVEMKEHSDDPKIALEITMDHLKEDPKYYGDDGENPDEKAKENAQNDAKEFELDLDSNDNGSGDDESELEKEILVGKMDTVGDNGTDNELEDLEFEYKPKNVGDEVVEDFDFAGSEREFYDKHYVEDDQKKYDEYTKKDFNNLSDDEKEEFFELWKQFGNHNSQTGSVGVQQSSIE